MPYPKGKNGSGQRNQEFGVDQMGRIRRNVEGDEHSDAEKTDRADGEGLLDAETVERGLGDGQFGGTVADYGEEHHKYADVRRPCALEKCEVEKPHRGGNDEQGKKERGEPEKDIRAAKVANGFLPHLLVLGRGDVAFAGPVLDQIVGAAGLFVGCAVGSQASLPNRRARKTNRTRTAMPVTRKKRRSSVPRTSAW